MSDVQVDELEDVFARYSFGYLLTVSDDGEAHVVAVQPTLSGNTLQIDGVGGKSVANLSRRPAVSLVWPPADFSEYSLIVNGDARQIGDARVVISLTRAVLHRPQELEDAGPGGCGSDCIPLTIG